MRSKRFWASAILVAVVGLVTRGPAAAGQAHSEKQSLVTVTTTASFEDTEANLRKYVSRAGMMVLGEINQGKALSMTGLSIKVKSLFVGNPTIGNKLFKANPGVGVAVPIRVTIFQTPSGKTMVSYVRPSQQLAPFSNPEITKIAGMLDQKLAKLTEMLAK